MVCTKLHSSIDTLSRSNTISKDANCFVNHRNQDTIYNKSGSFFYLNRCFTNFFCDSNYFIVYFICCVLAADNFNKLHNRSRVKEVHSDNRMRNACTDFCNGQRRSIRSENAVFFLYDILQFFECLFFNIHNFQSCLNNQITISTNVFYASCNLS